MSLEIVKNGFMKYKFCSGSLLPSPRNQIGQIPRKDNGYEVYMCLLAFLAFTVPKPQYLLKCIGASDQ